MNHIAWTACQSKQAAATPPPFSFLPHSLSLPPSLVKKRSVCKFTSWEQQELWKEVSADVAEWKGLWKEKEKEAANPATGCNPFLSFLSLFLLLDFANREMDTHRYAAALLKSRRANRQIYSEQMPAHITP